MRSPVLGWRELATVALLACLLAAATQWPVALHLGRDVPADLGDPLVEAWQVAWGGYALTEQPLNGRGPSLTHLGESRSWDISTA
jgi:hypothetical protein